MGIDEMTSTMRSGKREGFLGLLRATAMIAVLAGAAGSIGLWFHASRHPPLILVVLFVLWVLSPFAVLLMVEAVSKHWSVLTRTALYFVMLAVTLGSLAVYGDDALGHRWAKAAVVYVIVPPASWLLIAIVVPAAALVSGRRSRREG